LAGENALKETILNSDFSSTCQRNFQLKEMNKTNFWVERKNYYSPEVVSHTFLWDGMAKHLAE
jgi:hypothetical protein